jgi:TonB family protein
MHRPLPVLAALLIPLALAAGAAAPPADMPVDGAALLRTWSPPAYPPDALKENVGGMAMIRLVVDEQGKVASARVLDATDPRLGEAALAAARKWVFTPALDAGHPVEISLDAPVEFSPTAAGRSQKPGLLPPENQIPQPSPRTPAKPSATYSADYPDSLLERKLSGLVRFACTVTKEGQAVAVQVVVATHADFVIPALQSLQRWELTPGTQGDLPIVSQLGGDITFTATAAPPADVLAANLITAPDGTPPTALVEPRVVADPVAPYDLLTKGEGGSATVLYTVNEDGRPQDVRVQAATKPEYGEALVAAVEASVFSNPSDDGHSVSVPLRQRAEFPAIPADAKGDTDPVGRLVLALRAKPIGGSQGLDGKLVPLYRVAPEYPGTLRKAGRPAGRAEIEFIIDREGRARLPRVVSATREEFGWSAATAVSQWIFRVPLRGGQPADVRVRIPFDFKAPVD